MYDEKEMDVLGRSVISQFEQYVKLNKKVPPEVLTALAGIEQPGRLADTVAAHMSLKLPEKQKVLEILDVKKRLEHVLVAIEGEMDVLQIEKRIRGRVKAQMEKSQREYYLNEQMKAIQKELGESEEGADELQELEEKIAKAGMPKEAREKANAELNKLKMMSPMSAEATVVRNYVDWLVKVPWKKRSKINKDIGAAPSGCSTRTTTASRRSRSASSSTSRCSSGSTRSRARSCASSARPASARPRSGSRSRAPRTASSCACRSAACATRPRSAATGAPTSARCPARSCRTWPRPACAIRCSCSTRSTRCAMDFRGDPSSALLEVLDPEQNARSSITTSRSTSTCPT